MPATPSRATDSTGQRPGQRKGATADAPSDPQIEARRLRVAELLRARVPPSRIAQELGVDRKTVWRDTVAIREQWAERTSTTYEEWLAEELDRLERFEARMHVILTMPSAGPGDERAMKAVDRLLKIMERRARLLGLDAAQRVELSGPGGGPIEVDTSDAGLLAEVERMAERLAAVSAAAATPAEAAAPSAITEHADGEPQHDRQA